MTDAAGAPSKRPLLFGRPGRPVALPSPRGGSTSRLAAGSGGGGRVERIDDGFENARCALNEQVILADSFQAFDPQLVLVLEAVEDRTDVVTAAERVGLEVLIEVENDFIPDNEYALRSDRPKDPYVHASLHAVCGSPAAFDKLLDAWKKWKRTGTVPQNAKLRDLFKSLKTVRPWGPEDRLQISGLRVHAEGLLPDRLHPIEVELWYRRTPARRAESEREVRLLIESAGGNVVKASQIPAIGYHGLRCEVPRDMIVNLVDGSYDDVKVLKSANVMFLRVSGQSDHSLQLVADATQSSSTDSGSPPAGNPVLALLDGLPATNHPRLSGRVVVLDPDDIAAMVESRAELQHGTQMASVAIWGDLSSPDPEPAARPVLVRAILAPSSETANRIEEIRATELVPDLMERAFRDLFEPDASGYVVGEDIVVVNLSVGDPTAPFDTIMSSWARAIDWLSEKYGVLVVVSGGNHVTLPLSLSHDEFAALEGADRRDALLDSMEAVRASRRMLSPAESINALTVGALHSDSSTASQTPYQLDPAGGEESVSPLSPFGSGYRRSIKPDLVAPGGRAVVVPARIGNPPLQFRSSPSGAGVRVAHPGEAGEAFIIGTSPAAADVSRYAARLYDELGTIVGDAQLTRREKAIALKALVAHSASPPTDSYAEHSSIPSLIGHGQLVRDLNDGCDPNEATMLFIGEVSPGYSVDLRFPLPDGLNQRGRKTVRATLAWLSPVNWQHRQYRQAALSFAMPQGGIPNLKAGIHRSHDDATRGATTLQQLTWETNSSFGVGRGSAIELTVKCRPQGGMASSSAITFAVALTLNVAESLAVNVYEQVAAQVRVPVAPRVAAT